MKIAVLSDIHGNLPALKAIYSHIEGWQPDQVIVNGDVVNRGPNSRDCLHFVQEKQASAGWHLLRGNHEDYLLNCAKPDFIKNGLDFEINRFAYWAHQQLNGGTETMETWPEEFRWFAPDKTEFRVVHASMGHNRDGLVNRASSDVLRKQIAPAPAVFVTSHTHIPFTRQLDNTLIVNVGSVGSPFDHDWRPSYGQFTWTKTEGWRADVIRITYDRTLFEQEYITTGFLAEAGPLAQLMLIEHRRSRGLLYSWGSRYEQAVRDGKISMEESVKNILADEENRPFLRTPGWIL